MKVCHDCAATPAEAEFPARPHGTRAPIRCVPCAAAPVDSTPRSGPVITRASYRARYRRRAASPQLDLVDLLVPPP